MRIKKNTAALCALLLSVCILFCACTADNTKNPNKVKLDANNPVTVTVWHYYNGAQQEAFNELVAKFNNTVGKETGIIVEGRSQGNVSDLENSVIDAVNKNVGAGEIPSIFAAYADTAYAVDKLGYAVDVAPYLTEDEQNAFIDNYLEEGRFGDDGSVKIFPVAKSTEIFLLNKTDWEKFSSATGTSADEFATVEGLVKVAQKYYEWTDSLTPKLDDGKAFFGRDAMANYILIGAKQLGHEIFNVKNGAVTLDFDKDVMKILWDNYYIPYINGYFSSSGRFRSDDIKAGDIISFVGSSSGATFFPNKVVLSDTESYPVEMQVFQSPKFDSGGDVAVQQGAGMVVTKTDEKEIYASVQFLKWLVLPENNIDFSIKSGYLPVTKESNDIEKIKVNSSDKSEATLSIVSQAVDTVNNNALYTTKAFSGGTKARNILEYSMSDIAVKDRAAVEAAIASGKTRRQAVAEFISDDYFEQWYGKTLGDLQAVCSSPAK